MACTVRRPLFLQFDSQGAWTEDIFGGCVADVFERGILTVTCEADDRTMREYDPGQWIEAVVTDLNGHILYSLRPSPLPERQTA